MADPAPRPTWIIALPVSGLFVLAAVALEITGGVNANSTVPDWAELVPLAWPSWARVVWWLAVATAAAIFRVGLKRVGMPTNRLVDLLSIAPFAGFAVGIAIGADWATWH